METAEAELGEACGQQHRQHWRRVAIGLQGFPGASSPVTVLQVSHWLVAQMADRAPKMPTTLQMSASSDRQLPLRRHHESHSSVTLPLASADNCLPPNHPVVF